MADHRSPTAILGGLLLAVASATACAVTEPTPAAPCEAVAAPDDYGCVVIRGGVSSLEGDGVAGAYVHPAAIGDGAQFLSDTVRTDSLGRFELRLSRVSASADAEVSLWVRTHAIELAGVFIQPAWRDSVLVSARVAPIGASPRVARAATMFVDPPI